tara:strand:- start:374 stop:1099 length:726 start_codon:yes stop_codon:yes gene_type:complete
MKFGEFCLPGEGHGVWLPLKIKRCIGYNMNDRVKGDPLTSRVIPQQGRAMRRRVQILSVAEKLLEELEFSEVTTRKIAEAADIPIGSVYRYFPNKFSIMAAIAADTIETVDKDLTELLGSFEDLSDWERTIDKTIDIVTNAYMSRKGYVNILRAMSHTPELQNLTATYKEHMVKSLTQNFIMYDIFPAGLKASSVAETVIVIYNAMEIKVFLCSDETLRKALIKEWKLLVKCYLRCYFSES